MESESDDIKPKHFRLVFGIEYNGVGYYGWQYQPNLPTIQTTIWQALMKLLGGHNIINLKAKSPNPNYPHFLPANIVAAGRTDRGVHAKNQIIQIDIPMVYINRNDESWLRGFNNFLPPSIKVCWFARVKPDFDVRKSAIARRYKYFLQISKTPSPILKGLVGHYWQDLDLGRMEQGVSYLIGEHDFTTFRSSECQAKTPYRELYHIKIQRFDQFDNILILDFHANAFLHHMVRNILGSLIEVGIGAQPSTWIGEILKARDRKLAAKTFMPDGLYLWDVDYEYNIQKIFR